MSVKLDNMIDKLALQLLFSVSVVYCQNCVPLKDCPNLMNLLQNQDSMPNMTRADIYGYVRSLDCGFIGSKPMVNCTEPDIEGIHQISCPPDLKTNSETANSNLHDFLTFFTILVSCFISYWFISSKICDLKDLKFVKIQSSYF